MCVLGGGGCTHCISMGRECADKRGLIFSLSGTGEGCVCVGGGGGGGGGEGAAGFIVKNLEMDSNIPVWKGVHVCLERLGHPKCAQRIFRADCPNGHTCPRIAYVF